MTGEADRRAKLLVDGLAVLTGEGVLGSSGHLSVRLPGQDAFLINPRFPGALADPADLCVIGYDGEVLDGRFPPPSETPIHTAVYAARPDVMSVAHTHARSSVLVGLLDGGFVPVHRDAGLFHDGVPRMLDSTHIVAADQADEMASVLAGHRAMFLVGHGIVVVSTSIEETCVSAITLERACEDQLSLMKIGPVYPLDEVAGGAVRVNPNFTRGFAYRNWPLLCLTHGLATRDEIKSWIAPATELP